MEPTAALKDNREKLAAKRAELSDIFKQAGPERDLAKVEKLKALPDTTARVEAIKNLNDEVAELVKTGEPMEAEFAELTKAEREAEIGRRIAEEGKQVKRHPGHAEEGTKDGEQPEVKTIGELIADADLLKNKDKDIELDVSAKGVKTLFETGNGWEPETTRTGKLVDLPLSHLGAIDLIPKTTTTQAAVVYMQEVVLSDNAAEVLEGGAYNEAELDVDEATSPVRKIAVFLPVTDEQLEDVPQASGYINNRLPLMVQRRLSRQVLTGNGNSPNLEGILEASGLQTQALGGDDVTDAAYKALVKVNVTGDAQASAFVFNQLDWQDVVLMRTDDGVYIWGHPSQGGPQQLWGLPVAFDQSLAEGQQLVGDFRTYSELAIRRGLNVKVSDSHADYFIKGKQAIRADIRAALVNYRPSAFCEVATA